MTHPLLDERSRRWKPTKLLLFGICNLLLEIRKGQAVWLISDATTGFDISMLKTHQADFRFPVRVFCQLGQERQDSPILPNLLASSCTSFVLVKTSAVRDRFYLVRVHPDGQLVWQVFEQISCGEAALLSGLLDNLVHLTVDSDASERVKKKTLVTFLLWFLWSVNPHTKVRRPNLT